MARLRPAVYVMCRNYGNVQILPGVLFLRTTANFGQHSFTFDMVRFAEDYFERRRQRFECGARSLPDEIIAMIGVFAVGELLPEPDDDGDDKLDNL